MNSDPQTREVLADVPSFGAQLSDQLADVLGSRVNFPDPKQEFTTLIDLLEGVRGVAVDPLVLREHLQARVTGVQTATARDQLQSHAHMLTIGKAMIVVEETDDERIFDWEMIHPSEQSKVEATVDQLKQSINGNGPAIFDESEDETLVDGEQLFTGVITDLAKEIVALTPQSQPESGIVSRLARIAMRRPIEYSYSFYEPEVDDKVGKQVSRKVRQLNDLLYNLLKSPEDAIVAAVVAGWDEETVQELREDAEERVDDLMMEANVSVSPRVIDQKVKPNHSVSSEHRMSKRQARLAQRLAQQAEQADIEDAEEKGPQAEYRNMGEFELILPWVNGNVPTAQSLDKLVYQSVPVYIVRAFGSRNLASIAESSRGKAAANQGLVNKFDYIVSQRAMAVASGIMPYIRTKNVKHIRDNKRGPGYENTPIWYSNDAAPNAPRVYFTLKKLDEVMSKPERERLEADPNDHCLLVLAETDKANQVAVLAELEARSRASIRSGNAGSV